MPAPLRRLSALLLLASVALVAACGSDDGGDAILDPDSPAGSGPGALAVEGPDQAESGTLSVEADTITSGFLVTVTDISGDPVADSFVSIGADRGIINAPPSKANTGGANSDSVGEVAFSYQAPDDITSDTTVTITAQAEAAGGGVIEETYTLTVTAASAPVLTITGPTEVAPGIANEGFVLSVERASGTQVPEACVTLSASAGTIAPAADTTCAETGLAGNQTSATGSFSFSYTPPASIATDTAVRLTAKSTVAAQEGSVTYPITAVADTFRFTDPDSGSAVEVGADNRERLRFQWTRDPETPSGAEGVSGTLTLSVGEPARLAVGDDASGSEELTVSTQAGSSGDFAQEVYIFSNTAGSVQIVAHDDGADRDALLALQFVDAPSEINLDAEPLEVEASPSSARYSDLEVTVLNQVGEPIQGVRVEFELATPVAPGDTAQVFPSVQTTDEHGKAYSRFEAGAATGTAVVVAHVEGSTDSNERIITVVSTD